MRRRSVVATLCLLTGGCSTILPDNAPIGDDGSGTTTESPTPSTEYRDRFHAELAGNGMAVEYLHGTGDTVVLDYVTHATTRKELHSEIGWVAGLFADGIDRGWHVDSLDATVLGDDGLPLGVYRVDAAWARRYNQGESDPEEFSTRVLDTLEVMA